jgi:hypothetical protein
MNQQVCSSDQDKRDLDFVSDSLVSLYVPSTNYNKKEIRM